MGKKTVALSPDEEIYEEHKKNCKENHMIPSHKTTALMKNDITSKSSDFLIYTTPEGNVKIEAFLHDETIWLTQERMGELFGVQRPAITKHLQNIFESRELDENSVSSILEHTTKDGKKYQTIISINP